MNLDTNDTVVLAARALLGLSPPRAPETSPTAAFHSMALDARAVRAKTTTQAFTSSRSSPSAMVSCSEASTTSSDASVDEGYGSEATTNVETNRSWYTKEGLSVSLMLPQDSENLSPLHCFMRRYCVEAFCATEEDLTVPRYGKAHSGKVTYGQVGIRCLHCKHRPATERQERAVCFPSSLKNIYHSIETWQRRHSVVCQDIPVWIKTSMMDLMQRSRAGSGGRRQYWEESARLVGMATTSQGVRFVRKPGYLGAEMKEETSPALVEEQRASLPIVRKEDKEIVTDYLYTLLEQMETCQFTEQDRSGGRSKIKHYPVGFPGMQCKHCAGKCGVGRYFPASLPAMASANSDRNIFNHIIKCRKAPVYIREKLQALQKEHASMKNRRGQRKQFFHSVWERLHGPQAS